ncbi:hypothetical protein OSTOST_20281, partial [Ostertagia ostertagi]
MAVGQGVDVSKKLKAAIKAKLEELGVYVDDELPEYIMVMIANKKEKNQMKDDLNLFLGKCTNKFVDWKAPRRKIAERMWNLSHMWALRSETTEEVASSVIAQRALAASPEPVKVSSQVHVMRKVKTAT